MYVRFTSLVPKSQITQKKERKGEKKVEVPREVGMGVGVEGPSLNDDLRKFNCPSPLSPNPCPSTLSVPLCPRQQPNANASGEANTPATRNPQSTRGVLLSITITTGKKQTCPSITMSTAYTLNPPVTSRLIGKLLYAAWRIM